MTTDGQGLVVTQASGRAREWACHMSRYDDGWAGPSCYTGEYKGDNIAVPRVGGAMQMILHGT